MDNIWYEHRPDVRRVGRPFMVPAQDMQGRVGFRSVYGYTAETARQIRESGTTRNLEDIPVYSDVLLVDFDNDQDLAKAWYAEHAHLYNMDMYYSGNRSVHLHIRIEPMFGTDVPHKQRAWIRQHLPQADDSFYHKAGQFRLPGTYHLKNPGHMKTLLASTGVSTRLDLRDVEVPPAPIPIRGPTMRNASQLGNILLQFLATKVEPGHRNTHIFTTVDLCYKLGYDVDEATKMLQMWNVRLPSPHDEDYISRTVEEMYVRKDRVG